MHSVRRTWRSQCMHSVRRTWRSHCKHSVRRCCFQYTRSTRSCYCLYKEGSSEARRESGAILLCLYIFTAGGIFLCLYIFTAGEILLFCLTAPALQACTLLDTRITLLKVLAVRAIIALGLPHSTVSVPYAVRYDTSLLSVARQGCARSGESLLRTLQLLRCSIPLRQSRLIAVALQPSLLRSIAANCCDTELQQPQISQEAVARDAFRATVAAMLRPLRLLRLLRRSLQPHFQYVRCCAVMLWLLRCRYPVALQ
jgi:hypothetical protein